MFYVVYRVPDSSWPTLLTMPLSGSHIFWNFNQSNLPAFVFKANWHLRFN